MTTLFHDYIFLLITTYYNLSTISSTCVFFGQPLSYSIVWITLDLQLHFQNLFNIFHLFRVVITYLVKTGREQTFGIDTCIRPLIGGSKVLTM